MIRRLPAERHSVLAEAPAFASLELNAGQRELIARGAAEANACLDDFLLAGFAGLLGRLAWQERIAIVCHAPEPSLVTFMWEHALGFQAALSTRKTELLPREDPVREGAAYQFLGTRARAVPHEGAALRLTAKEEPGLLRLVLASSSPRWGQATLKGWVESLGNLLLAGAQSPATPLASLPLMDQAQVLDFYRQLNDTASEYDAHTCVHNLIIKQAERTPDSIAVKFRDRQLTYRELERQSTLRAQHLAAMGAGPNRPIAICMERSEQLPVALLAVLKAGSCYVPLDPHHPRQRLVSTLEECKPVAVISDSAVAPSLGSLDTPILCIDDHWPVAAVPKPSLVCADDLAYIIYTSGSTGKPKGVQVRHRGLVNLFHPESRMPKLDPSDRLLAITTISFDIATMDMLMPLASGATLVIADRFAAADAFELARLLDDNDATLLQATPFTWRLLVNSGWSGKANLRMISGGEALPRDLANQLLPLGKELWNCYGPTETTIYSSAIRLQVEDGIVPLGPPIANTTFYVIDEGGRPVPPGVPGELCIGGAGVSSGYFERPELTSKRFIADPFSSPPGTTLFRTGDLVRALSRHELEFMGRLDHQVKLRGYRIELAEIESVLRSHPCIENAAVILREDIEGEPRLVAYVTLAEGMQLKSKEIRHYAGQYLPDYMLPSRVVGLSALPLTGSGKIDRRSLPAPETLPGQEEGLPEAANVPPANELEAKLLDIFREVLGRTSIGVTDSFFDYGGYSLLTARLFARIHRAIGKKLPISLLFDASTVRQLAEVISKDQPLQMVVPIRKEGRAAPLFVIHSYLIYAALCEAIEEDRPIFGVRELDDAKPMNSLEERGALYAREINRVYPEGPLSLVGWCLAGSLTVEVARQLREQGRIVAVVALFDSECPGYKPRTGDGSSLLKARVVSFAKFHSERLRDLDWQARLKYLSARTTHRWNDLLETAGVRQRAAARWLERNLGFALPESVRERLTLLGADDLRPAMPQSYPGKIILFRASDVVQISNTEPSLGWAGVAQDGVIVEFAPGDHESMFRDPHLPRFGEMLSRVLREGEASYLSDDTAQQAKISA
ncbi:MAG: amino acid adenylation domain-containing protein [Acidobacteriaceae bacterium]|nr:amino acid adenylation domain-containing protein [Acidobacteriaceae bacterium]